MLVFVTVDRGIDRELRPLGLGVEADADEFAFGDTLDDLAVEFRPIFAARPSLTANPRALSPFAGLSAYSVSFRGSIQAYLAYGNRPPGTLILSLCNLGV
jgi:hypothetical protein